MSGTAERPMSGRRAEAARNDEAILAAARAVFVDDPDAPIAAVAERAGVGIGALYRRYPGKEQLLATLCLDGLRTYVELVEAALAGDGDAWADFAGFMRAATDAGTSALTARLAGTFTPTADHVESALRAFDLNRRLIERARGAGVLREDFEVSDMAAIFELLASIRVGDEERAAGLRRRYLQLILDGVRIPAERNDLPSPAPSEEELSARWVPR